MTGPPHRREGGEGDGGIGVCRASSLDGQRGW